MFGIDATGDKHIYKNASLFCVRFLSIFAILSIMIHSIHWLGARFKSWNLYMAFFRRISSSRCSSSNAYFYIYNKLAKGDDGTFFVGIEKKPKRHFESITQLSIAVCRSTFIYECRRHPHQIFKNSFLVRIVYDFSATIFCWGVAHTYLNVCVCVPLFQESSL